MKTNLTGKSLAGATILKHSGATFHGVNPATGAKLEPAFTGIGPAEVDAVARQAQKAFAEYGTRSGSDKAAFLRAIAANIDAVVDDLVERTCAETALPEPRVRAETGRTTGQLRMFAALVEEGSWVDARLETAQPDRKPLPKPDIRSMRQPLGPVVVFCASNFPLAFSVAGGDTAAALAAGCPVIVKAHHSHPGTAEIIGQAVLAAVQSCGLPAGTFSLIFGGGRDVGIALVKHPAVKAVGFTGSRAGGTALMKAAFDREEPIPVYAEMSSVNPVVILPEALATKGDALAAGLQGSVTLGMGQFCTNPGLVLLPAGEVAEKFADALGKALATTAPGCLLNDGIAAAYREALQKRQNLVPAGVEIVCADPGKAAEGACKVGAALFKVDAATFLKHELLAEEAFGPATTIVTWSSKDELLAVINSLEGQLTGTVHGTAADLNGAGEVLAALQGRVGRLIFGGFPTGVEVCHSMVHGGPFPSTSDGRGTSVGTMAIDRFCRAFCWQGAPEATLPAELRNANPLGIWRMVNGTITKDPVA